MVHPLGLTLASQTQGTVQQCQSYLQKCLEETFYVNVTAPGTKMLQKGLCDE